MTNAVDDPDGAPPSRKLSKPETNLTDARPHLRHPHSPSHDPEVGNIEHPRLPSRSRIQNISTYGSVAADATAAAFSLAASRLSSQSAVVATATLSGIWWTGAATLREVGNSPRSNLVSSTNFLGGAAGVFSTAAPFLFGENLKGTAYASAGSWATQGVANISVAVGNSKGKLSSRLLVGASGAANIVAAGLSAAAVNASANSNSTTAANFATMSSVMWMIGSTADALAAWAERKEPALSDGPHLAPGGEADHAADVMTHASDQGGGVNTFSRVKAKTHQGTTPIETLAMRVMHRAQRGDGAHAEQNGEAGHAEQTAAAKTHSSNHRDEVNTAADISTNTPRPNSPVETLIRGAKHRTSYDDRTRDRSNDRER